MVMGSTHELWVPEVSELPNQECCCAEYNSRELFDVGLA
jgi:hypothetical protein